MTQTAPNSAERARNAPTSGGNGHSRVDLVLIASMIEPGSRVLDVGCGDGALLHLLEQDKGVDGRGIEISQRGVNNCVAKGLSVIQGDADTDLENYPDDAFDYVVLSQTLQATRHPKQVLENMLRIGRFAVVSFPNFGHWRLRMQLLVRGKMPMTGILANPWYDTENIHFFTMRDFVELIELMGASIDRAVALDEYGKALRFNAPWWVWNFFGEQGVFLLRR